MLLKVFIKSNRITDGKYRTWEIRKRNKKKIHENYYRPITWCCCCCCSFIFSFHFFFLSHSVFGVQHCCYVCISIFYLGMCLCSAQNAFRNTFTFNISILLWYVKWLGTKIYTSNVYSVQCAQGSYMREGCCKTAGIATPERLNERNVKNSEWNQHLRAIDSDCDDVNGWLMMVGCQYRVSTTSTTVHLIQLVNFMFDFETVFVVQTTENIFALNSCSQFDARNARRATMNLVLFLCLCFR